ncbi:hypothetical protein MHB42_11685 [Lysinibacillus sp. FSL K6-0232]|uniref:hypothetical protein n=1 Tax=unclassified Lysinibacillus TaxID=2636778 RepID=UPI0030F6A26D
MKTVNFQLDGMNSLEITHLDNDLFEVRLAIDGQIALYYMTRVQVRRLGATYCAESTFLILLDE